MFRALIVEDDVTSQMMLQRFLEPHAECHVVAGGKEAVQAFKMAKDEERPYRLICLDIMIPEMDGQAVLKEVRSMEAAEMILDGRGVKVIMTSSLTDGHNVMTAFRELCDGYLVKPFDRAKLLEQLRRFRLIV